MNLKTTDCLGFLERYKHLGQFTQKICITLAINVYCKINGVPGNVRGRELLHPVLPSDPWGNNPFLTDVIKHLSYEYPGGRGLHVYRSSVLCDSFQSILDQQEPKSFYFKVNHLFDKNYSWGDVIFVGDDQLLRFTCVISHFDGDIPCAEYAMKSSPFAFEGAHVKLQQNHRKKVIPDDDTLHVYRRKTTMQLVSYFEKFLIRELFCEI